MRREVLLVLMALPIATSAQEGACAQVSTSQEVYECSKAARMAADRALNSEYKRVLQAILKAYRSDRLGKELVGQVKEAQLAWLRLRDSDCAVESFIAERGTLAHETTWNNCIARMTRERTSYLPRITEGL